MAKAEATKDAFITLAPVTPKGKWGIAARRIGTADRFACIAESRSEQTADRIVLALTMLQGEKEKLEEAQRPLLEDLRRQLEVSRAQATQLTKDLSGERGRLREERAAHDITRAAKAGLEVEYSRLSAKVKLLQEKAPA